MLDISADENHRPCPFKGAKYQWMRNLVACAAVGQSTGKQAAFVVVCVDGPFPMAKKVRNSNWQRFAALTAGKSVALVDVSYQSLIGSAIEAVQHDDRETLLKLREWIDAKIANVACSF